MQPVILSFFTNENATLIASELCQHVEAFRDFGKKSKAEKEKIGIVDFSYDLSKGRVQTTGNNSNTWFAFDLKPDTTAFKFMKAMYEEEIDDAQTELLNEFVGKIATKISENHTDAMRSIIRSAVLPDSEERVVPLNKVEVLGIEIVDYSSVDDDDRKTVRFIKLPGIPTNMHAINSRITAVRDENPGMSIEQIIHKERLAANPIFDAVMGVQMGDKYLWDVQIAMFVDYSFADEFLEAVKFANDKKK